MSFTHNIELSNALLDQFADFGGIQLHAPVPLRLQDVCKALKTTAYAAINDHITRSDDNAYAVFTHVTAFKHGVVIDISA